MRSEELNTIKYVIKNFNLLKTQFHILHSYRIADYIEGKVDFLDKYNMSDFISLIEKLSYTFIPSQCTTMIRLTKLSCTHFKAKILEK